MTIADKWQEIKAVTSFLKDAITGAPVQQEGFAGSARVTTNSAPSTGAFESGFFFIDGGTDRIALTQDVNLIAAASVVLLFNGFSITPTKAQFILHPSGETNGPQRGANILVAINQGSAANYATLFNTIDNVGGGGTIAGGVEVKMVSLANPIADFDNGATAITDMGAIALTYGGDTKAVVAQGIVW